MDGKLSIVSPIIFLKSKKYKPYMACILFVLIYHQISD